MVVLKEMSNMFWGLTIDGGRHYFQTVDKGFAVSMAALEVNPEAPKKASYVQVMVQHEATQFLLCTLGPDILQQRLELAFSSGESVEFFLNGNGVVHLTGSLFADEEDDEDFSDDDALDDLDSDSESEAPALVDDEEDDSDLSYEPELPAAFKRKGDEVFFKGKKIKLDNRGDFDMLQEPWEEFASDEEFIDDITPGLEDEEESSEEKEEEDGESADVPTRSPKPPPSKKASPLDSSLDTSSLSKKKKKKKKKKDGDAKTAGNQPKRVEATPAGDTPNGDPTSEKKKKKKKNKQGENAGQQQEGGMEKPAAAAAAAVVTPKPSPALGKKRSVAGGTSVEDLKIGHGPEAKPGSTVSVYYSGTLAKNNKRFDSCLKGKPFRFRLGRGEVIKGWDTGLIGMKVGGKRKITVPPAQGYGNARQGPIPPGSTLVFDVEIKAVN